MSAHFGPSGTFPANANATSTSNDTSQSGMSLSLVSGGLRSGSDSDARQSVTSAGSWSPGHHLQLNLSKISFGNTAISRVASNCAQQHQQQEQQQEQYPWGVIPQHGLDHGDISEALVQQLLFSPDSQTRLLPILTPDEVERTLDGTAPPLTPGHHPSTTRVCAATPPERRPSVPVPPSSSSAVVAALPARPYANAMPVSIQLSTSSIQHLLPLLNIAGGGGDGRLRVLPALATTANAKRAPASSSTVAAAATRSRVPRGRRQGRGGGGGAPPACAFATFSSRMEKLRQQKANARRREHERVKKTRLAFERLKNCLVRSDPIAKTYMRCFNMVSKINILKAATAHIAELTSQLQESCDADSGAGAIGRAPCSAAAGAAMAAFGGSDLLPTFMHPGDRDDDAN